MVENDTSLPVGSADGEPTDEGEPLDRAEPSAEPADDSPENGDKGTSAGSPPLEDPAAPEVDPEAAPPDGEDEDPLAGMSEKERAFLEMMSRANESPRYKACDECDGLGHVRTGSLVSEEFALIACEGCAGQGYVARPAAPGAATPIFAPGEPPAPGMVFDPQRGIWAYPGT